MYLESYRRKAEGKSPTRLAASEDSAPPRVALVFFRGGVKISEAGPFPGKWISRDDKATYFVDISLAKFPSGRYSMQVNVLDPAAELVAFARIPVAILTAPASLPNAAAGPQ